MNEPSPNVIAVGYAKRALVEGSRERMRMVEYATVLGSYHLIVFTRKKEHFPAVQQEGKLSLYATNSCTRIGMLWSAYRIGRKIIATAPKGQWVVSGQDPFATSLVTRALAFWRKNIFLHVQIHGDVFNSQFFVGTWFSGIKTRFATRTVLKAKKIRVVSQRIKESLVKLGVLEERIAVLPIQANLETFLSAGEIRQYSKTGPATFLYVGRLAPEKNIELLLEAFSQLQKNGNLATLQILGDGPLKKKLIKTCKKLAITDKVVFLPWSDDVVGTLAQADVLCLSSLHEGFAMVLVEAMSAGLPVVTTDVGCAGEVVKNHLHGYVVPVNDIPAYVSALTRLSDDASLRERLGKSGHLTIKESRLADSAYLQAIKDSFTI